MLVTFYSEAYENIVMFESSARHLIKLMGHSDTIPGAILAEEIPQTLLLLQQKLKELKTTHLPSSFSNNEDPGEEITLAQRAFPLLNMLKAASEKKCDVLWK